MTVTRGFNGIDYGLTDYTEQILLIPNQWGLLNDMGIFRNEGVSQHNITVEQSQGTLGLIGDKVRGARANVNKDDTRKTLAYNIPHFPLDDQILPADVQGKRAYGSPDAAETEMNVLKRKMERIRRSHAATLEAARAHCIVNGTIYAPNGTVAGNYFTDFNVTRKYIAFDLANSTDINASSEEAIAHIQDEIQTGENVSGVVAICSPEFFSDLIANTSVKDAYKYYSSTQEPLRNRLGGMGLYRRFVHGGVTYIEYRGSYNGTRLIPANYAFFIPEGTEDTFISYYSPANKFASVNTLGEEAYIWTYRDKKDSMIEVESEANFLNLCRRPQVLVSAHSAATHPDA